MLIFLGSLTNGGTERVVVGLSKYLANKKNYSVTVVTLDSEERDFYKLDANVKRIAMNEAGASFGLFKFLKNIKRVFLFRKIVKKEKADIVLGMITRHAIIAILASFKLPVKVIVSERNYPGLRGNHLMWDFLRRYIYRFADKHVVQTEKIADWIRKNTHSKDVVVIPNSISLPIPQYSPKLSPIDYLNVNEKMILAVGSFKHQKGFDLLIRSLSKVLPKYSDWKLFIVGDEKEDGQREAYSKLISTFDLNDQIILPGKAGNVGDWYNRADIFVLSSRYEGFPNVLLEAMASGCACVSFDCNTGPSDLIENNENGLLVTPNDTNELAAKVEELINNATKRINISNKAEKVIVEYSETNILEKWLKIFKHLNSN